MYDPDDALHAGPVRRHSPLRDLKTNVSHVRGKPSAGGAVMRAQRHQMEAPARQPPPPRMGRHGNDSTHSAATHGSLGMKGLEQGSSRASDMHLSVHEVTQDSVDLVPLQQGRSSPVRLGTSFLDRPWLPPDSSTSSEADDGGHDADYPRVDLHGMHDAHDAQDEHDAHDAYDAPSSKGRCETTSSPSPSQQGAHPHAALPLCDCCNSAILGKYYEKQGVTVHVECFKLYLKGSRKTSTAGGSSKTRSQSGRKSPLPRRAPPPCPMPVQVGAGPGHDVCPPAVPALQTGRDRAYDAGGQHASEPAAPAAPAPRTTEVMERLMPRDSDGSGSWLAHPGSLEPMHRITHGSLPPASPPQSAPQQQQQQHQPNHHHHHPRSHANSASPPQHGGQTRFGRPPTTPSPGKAGALHHGTGALHSLTVSPEAMTDATSRTSRSPSQPPFVMDTHDATSRPLHLDLSDAPPSDRHTAPFQLGSISPIHAPAEGLHDGEELLLEADVQPQPQQQQQHLPTAHGFAAPVGDEGDVEEEEEGEDGEYGAGWSGGGRVQAGAEEGCVGHGASPMQPASRSSVATASRTPSRQLVHDLGQSPPSKALSTKLESPETPQTDADHLMHSLTSSGGCESDDGEVGGIVQHSARYPHAAQHSEEREGAVRPHPQLRLGDMSSSDGHTPGRGAGRHGGGQPVQPVPLRMSDGPGPSTVHIGERSSVWRNLQGSESRSPEHGGGPPLTAADLLLSGEVDDPAHTLRQFDLQNPDFSLISQCAVADSPSPVRRDNRPQQQQQNHRALQSTVVMIRPSPRWSSTRKRSTSAGVSAPSASPAQKQPQVQTQPQPQPQPRASLRSLRQAPEPKPVSAEEAALRRRVEELEAEGARHAVREAELEGRLSIAEAAVCAGAEWEREASRVLRELIGAKVELATLKTHTNPLTALRQQGGGGGSARQQQQQQHSAKGAAAAPQHHSHPPPSLSPGSASPPSVSPPRCYRPGPAAQRSPAPPAPPVARRGSHVVSY